MSVVVSAHMPPDTEYAMTTTLLIKMQKARYTFVTLLPLIFMCAVTFSAGYLKIFSSDPRLGFLSGARSLMEKAGALGGENAIQMLRQAAVWRVDAAVAGSFLGLVLLIVAGSAVQWWQLLRGTRPAVLRESEFIPLSQLEAAG